MFTFMLFTSVLITIRHNKQTKILNDQESDCMNLMVLMNWKIYILTKGQSLPYVAIHGHYRTMWELEHPRWVMEPILRFSEGHPG